MIISNNRTHSASEAMKYYRDMFVIYYAHIIVLLRKGDRPTQTKVFLALGTAALILAMTLNLFHVIDINIFEK